MTKDEFREYVMVAINGYVSDPRQDDDVIDKYVDQIVAQWEKDVEAAKTAFDPDFKEDDGSAACSGPCCSTYGDPYADGFYTGNED